VRIRIGLVTLVVFVLAGAVACTHSTSGRSGSPPASPAAGHDGMSMGVTTTTAPGTATKASPEQLGAQFEQLLGRHALLAARLMRSAVMAAPDFRQAAVASLQENTDALSQLVGSAYGSAQGERYRQLWQRRTDDLFAYANGVAGNDASAKQTARAALMTDADAYGSWLAEASNGQARAGDAATFARTNVQELMQQLDAYAAHDYDKAYQLERSAYEQMFTGGATLAKASVPPKAAAALDAPPNKLRSAFAMLLGEHMELIIDAQRATFAGSPEFHAAAAQINANSTALAQGLGSIVGPKKGAEFQSAWADHVAGLMAYTTAVASDDQAGKAAAEDKLHSFAVTLATYFSGVVHTPAAFVPLTGAITAHDTHLIDQVNAYAARDYAKAQQMELHGYEQMLGVANTLVDAIQRTVKPGMPVGGSQTGGGGTAQRP
jgi:ABC-type transporter lipoprotein component MlaA